MSDKPVWLLDIDGVINAAGKSLPTHAWPEDTWREIRATDTKGFSWRIVAAQPVLDFLREVHEAGRAEIRWHTTWQERALDVGDALGLPTFHIAHAPEFDESAAWRKGQWWKVPAARRVLAEEGRALVWTDDDASTDLSRQERAEMAALGRLLVVSPSTETGLCRKHLRMIDKFLPAAERHRARLVLNRYPGIVIGVALQVDRWVFSLVWGRPGRIIPIEPAP